MAIETGISWTTSTFNPWIGCSKVGPGCDHCYAEARMDSRLHVVNWGPKQPRKHTSVANWRGPVKWNAERARAIAAGENPLPHRVFCSSLADVFDNEVSEDWRIELFELIRSTPHLTWQLLTKRIGNAKKMIDSVISTLDIGHDPEFAAWPWPNVWIGATVVNQAEADRDIPKLLDVPAAVRFLSIEPMLGPIDLLATGDTLCRCDGCMSMAKRHPESAGLQRIDWVICGGESGKDARPMHPDWARSLRDQCSAAGVPFFFKQWGEHSYEYDRHRDDPDYRKCNEWDKKPGRWINLAGGHGLSGERVHYAHRVGTKAAGNLLDGVQWQQFPDVPA